MVKEKFSQEAFSKKMSAGERKINEFQNKSKGLIGMVKDTIDMFSLLGDWLGDWLGGRYKVTPTRSITAITIAVIYAVCPIALMMDFVPILGLVDDAFILAFTVKQFSKDLNNYRHWKFEQEVIVAVK